MQIGVLSTSWPSAGSPWAGHFVADQAAELVRQGHQVVALAPSFKGERPLESRAGVQLLPVPVPWTRGTLKRRIVRGGITLLAMRRRAARLKVDVWWCHWWPTVLAASPHGRRAVLLHGSDMDLLERAPRPVSAWLADWARVAAVAPGVARRFAARAGTVPVPVHPLGAHRGAREVGRHLESSPQRRVLTVARDVPGKGLAVARAARRLCPDVHWRIVTPRDGLCPADVREAIAGCDLLVVPSMESPGLPQEGRPHVLAQAAVASVPVVGGPNRAVRETLRAWGQYEVVGSGPEALAAGVRMALTPGVWPRLAERMARHGAALTWPEVTQRAARWLEG